MKKQIEWFSKWLNLRSEMEKQKESIISQFSMDIDKFINSIDSKIKEIFKDFSNMEESSKKMKKYIVWIKRFLYLKSIYIGR